MGKSLVSCFFETQCSYFKKSVQICPESISLLFEDVSTRIKQEAQLSLRNRAMRRAC